MSDEPSLTRFAGRVGTTLRAIIAGVPIVGGGASSVLTDMAFEDLRRRLARLEGTFAWFGERLGLYDSDVRSSLDGFQLLRLRRFLERATQIEDEAWWGALADVWLLWLVNAEVPAEAKAEVDRVVLEMEPHDWRVLRWAWARDSEEARRDETDMVTATGLDPSIAMASVGRLVRLGLVVDGGVNKFGGYGGPRLGRVTDLGRLVHDELERAEALTREMAAEAGAVDVVAGRSSDECVVDDT